MLLDTLEIAAIMGARLWRRGRPITGVTVPTRLTDPALQEVFSSTFYNVNV